ncbi:crossover junction endodeoxyribonuclease RuvC [Candidatus Azambacteria bacterium RIFCSPHIGHO2_01_FULL_40_24]|uniref:Crossover junction endodeoxyribonuclease RuvC n=1 Tax=Candidatus Azambacteria bacterium RIFCSPHIGHO2_01_FULL_40_24 TaxID=1797301 RepID=A0A1F5B4Q7_9BACT|nr:MAG: crossover junction endodeoxyribonuclease RuvC [Candidatus Azambacteria bacterium RIFCSPHIGHO2_01_FULL_40_24]
MIILGIDPGTTRIGYALLNKKENSNVDLIIYGCLELPNKSQTERLTEISQLISDLIAKHCPVILAIEKLFFTKNAKTAFSVSEARGVIINAAASLNLEILEFTPLEIKVAVTGYGKAEKREIQKMICRLLNLEKMPQPDDASDAIAIGLTACYTNQKLIIKP